MKYVELILFVLSTMYFVVEREILEVDEDHKL